MFLLLTIKSELLYEKRVNIRTGEDEDFRTLSLFLIIKILVTGFNKSLEKYFFLFIDRPFNWNV